MTDDEAPAPAGVVVMADDAPTFELDRRGEIRRLWEAGLSQKKIGEIVGIHPSSARQHLTACFLSEPIPSRDPDGYFLRLTRVRAHPAAVCWQRAELLFDACSQPETDPLPGDGLITHRVAAIGALLREEGMLPEAAKWYLGKAPRSAWVELARRLVEVIQGRRDRASPVR